MAYRLDALHARLRASGSLQRLTLLTRTLLAVGFIAPGLTKVLGFAFAPGLDPASAAGAYFEAFQATGFYYGFVGAVQALAGALLLWRRTALAGALLYLPVIANIALLTTAIGFGTGTPIATALMLLACLWLVTWDAHRLVGVVAPAFRPAAGRAVEAEVWDLFAPPRAGPRQRLVLRSGYVLGTAGALAFTLAAREVVPYEALGPSALAVGLGALLTLAGCGASLVGPRRLSTPEMRGHGVSRQGGRP